MALHGEAKKKHSFETKKQNKNTKHAQKYVKTNPLLGPLHPALGYSLNHWTGPGLQDSQWTGLGSYHM